MRKPVRLADLQTRQEAVSYLRTAFERQLEASIDANTEPNKDVAGDYVARQAFNVLLAPTEQRAFFQQLVQLLLGEGLSDARRLGERAQAVEDALNVEGSSLG